MKLAHRIEGAAARAALRLLRALGPVRASNVGGAIARTLGPRLPESRIADANLRLAMPELDAQARRRTIRAVWDNLGRTAGEFPHLRHLHESAEGPGWTVVGAEHIEALARRGGPALLFGGHIDNFEVMRVALARKGVRLAGMYRPAENKVIDDLISQLRREGSGEGALLFAKGAQGARQALMHLKQGGFIGLLQDQKMNDGIEARFFGHPAMTASALAALALRLRCPVLPIYTYRTAPARFVVTCEPPLPLPDSGDRAADIASLTQAANDRLEAWIRAKPESWLWVHRRWPKEMYQPGSRHEPSGGPGLPPVAERPADQVRA